MFYAAAKPVSVMVSEAQRMKPQLNVHGWQFRSGRFAADGNKPEYT